MARAEAEGPDKDWSAFYAACDKDLPNWPVISILRSLGGVGAETWIFSGRSDEVREKTIEWLELEAGIYLDWDLQLNLRQEGDFTPDEQLKKSWLDVMFEEDRKRLVAVFDDRSKVVQMWRDNCITCFQVAPGEF